MKRKKSLLVADREPTMRRKLISTFTSSVVVLSLILLSTVPAVPPITMAQTQKPSGPNALQFADRPVDRGWPRGYSLANEAQIVLYQPQVISWADQKHMVALAAVSYIGKDEKKPSLGTINIEAETSVSLPERLVKFSQLKITQANFQSLPKEQASEIISTIQKAIPEEDRLISLDRVLVQVDKSQVIPKNLEGIKSDPPEIFLSKTPAILLSFDGDPIWSPIKDNELKFAVNTNWDVFQHGPTNVYYLRNEDTWLRAVDLKGPWTPAGKLPESFSKLPADDNWKEVKENLPGKPASKPPTVYFSTKPAELILLKGEPNYVAV